MGRDHTAGPEHTPTDHPGTASQIHTHTRFNGSSNLEEKHLAFPSTCRSFTTLRDTSEQFSSFTADTLSLPQALIRRPTEH